MRIIFWFLVLQSLPALAEETALQVLDKAVQSAAADANAGALLDVHGCGISYLQSAGIANRKTKLAMPLQEPLRLASIGKLYTASVIHRLAAQGLLDLTSPIDRYLEKNMSQRVPNSHATLNQLLNHTSGVPDYYDWRSYLFWDWKKPLTTDRILKVVERRKAKFLPGERYEYSNANYHLLALAAERVTGTSFSELVSIHVLRSLDLTNTQYNTVHPGGTIHGYGTLLRPWADTWSLAENTGPDSGITANTSDLRRFLQATFFSNGKHANIGEKMQTPLVATAQENQRAGAGAEVFSGRDGLVLVGHTGDTFGYVSFAFAIPAYEITLIGHINAAKPQLLTSLLKRTVQAVRIACT